MSIEKNVQIVRNVREYVDTQALARASEVDASPRP